jgi:hypothetical protein
MKNNNFIQINGVSYNADAVSKMTLEAFIQHGVEQGHYKHLTHGNREKAIIEAYYIICPKKNEDGDIKRTNRKSKVAKEQSTDNSTDFGIGDEGTIHGT